MMRFFILLFFVSWTSLSGAQERRAPVAPTPGDAEALKKEFLAITKGRHFISFQVQRSNKILDWKSPASILGSVLYSEIDSEVRVYKHAIGHATIVYSNGKDIKGIAQTGDFAGKDLELIQEGFGFRAITDIQYLDGFLQDTAMVQLSNQQASALKDRFAWMIFFVDPAAIVRLEDFLQSYRAAGADHSYGFAADPMLLQGGGCTSFVNAALKVAGLDFPALDRWVRSLPIPEEFLGFDKAYLRQETQVAFIGETPADRFVKPLSIFGRKTWAQDGEPAEPFHFLDPEYFYQVSRLLLQTQQGSANVEPLPTELNGLSHDLIQWLQDHANRIETRTLYGVSGLLIHEET